MIHPDTELKLVSPEMGYGVYATALIPRGSMTYVRDALEIEIAPGDDIARNPLFVPVIEKYSYIDPRGNRVISWDIAKYVNHACDFNTISTGYGFEIAVRDIEPGEQITDDYGLFNMTETLHCGCGAANCRGVVQASDLDHRCHEYDAVVKAALEHFNSIDQPLLGYLDRRTHSKLLTYLNGGKRYVSVRHLRWNGLAASSGVRRRTAQMV